MAVSLDWVMIPRMQHTGGGVSRRKWLGHDFFVTPTKRGRPWKPLGIVGATVGFEKRPRIGVILSCLLWSTCICMAGQRTQLTVEWVRKKGPASEWIVGFCPLPKFAPPSELLLQMGLSDRRRAERRGMGGQMRGLECCKNVHLGCNRRFTSWNLW